MSSDSSVGSSFASWLRSRWVIVYDLIQNAPEATNARVMFENGLRV
jgi:hypothetical protein